jgi:hypothetical protein
LELGVWLGGIFSSPGKILAKKVQRRMQDIFSSKNLKLWPVIFLKLILGIISNGLLL